MPTRAPVPALATRSAFVGPALVVTGAYLAAGVGWIVGSEWVLSAVVGEEQATSVQVLKGIGFVLVTSAALYVVLGRMMSNLEEAARTQAVQAERLREYAAQQRLLAQRLMRAEEDTRRAVAKDLHDGALQSLTLSFMRLDAASRSPVGRPIDPEQVASAMTAIREASEEIRAVVRALHPPLLAELGLSAAVERHCHEMSSRTGRDVEFSVDGDRNASMEPDVAIAAFRITQEAISNALKHTTGDPVTVRLRVSTSHIEAEVVDQGPGFNPAIQSASGLGLVSMRERAESVGGALTVTSTSAGGTHVRLAVPGEASHTP